MKLGRELVATLRILILPRCRCRLGNIESEHDLSVCGLLASVGLGREASTRSLLS